METILSIVGAFVLLSLAGFAASLCFKAVMRWNSRRKG